MIGTTKIDFRRKHAYWHTPLGWVFVEPRCTLAFNKYNSTTIATPTLTAPVTYMDAIEFDDRFCQMTSMLQAFAYNLTKNQEDAKDLYQETAFRAMTNREKFRAGTNFKAWLFTIMKNIFINNYRRRVKGNSIIESADNLYYLNSGWDTTGNKAETRIFMAELRELIDKLDETLRTPFMLHYRGFKYQEIADQLGLPLGTVKSRIFFARKELKAKVDARYDNYASVRLQSRY